MQQVAESSVKFPDHVNTEVLTLCNEIYKYVVVSSKN